MPCHTANPDLHPDCSAGSCPQHADLLPKKTTPRVDLRILYVFPADFEKPSYPAVCNDSSYTNESFDRENEGDRTWLDVMKERIKGFEYGICIVDSKKLVYIWAWVSVSRH